MYKIEDLADWNSNYKLNTMGRGTEAQRKAVERIGGKLLQRQFMIHRYRDDKKIQMLVNMKNSINEEIIKLEEQMGQTCQDIEQYFIDNEGSMYAPYVQSNQLYKSNYSEWLERNELK
jgi:hypothetical protein